MVPTVQAPLLATALEPGLGTVLATDGVASWLHAPLNVPTTIVVATVTTSSRLAASCTSIHPGIQNMMDITLMTPLSANRLIC